jgi:hypothetical protein
MLALTLPKSGVVRSRTQATEFSFYYLEHYSVLIYFTLKWAKVAEWVRRMSRCLITDLTEPEAAHLVGVAHKDEQNA